MRKEWTVLLLACFLFVAGEAVQAQELRYYNIDISLPKGGHLSGICIIRMEGADGAMSVVNQFGIKAFDAVYRGDKNKVKIRNVMPMLDKWYIRRVVAKDMSFLFNPDRKVSRCRHLLCKDDGSMKLSNNRFKIIYSLQPIEENVVE